MLVVEGSIPNEDIKEEGYWAAMEYRSEHRSAHQDHRMDRPSRAQGLGSGWRRYLCNLRRHSRLLAMGNPTGCMGLAEDYLGWNWRSKAGLPIVNVPGCPVQPDNFMETLLYLLFQVSGLAPMIPLDEQLRPTWLFGKTVHEGCDRAAYYEQDDFALEYGSTGEVSGEDRLLGAGGQLQRHQARMDARYWWLS